MIEILSASESRSVCAVLPTGLLEGRIIVLRTLRPPALPLLPRWFVTFVVTLLVSTYAVATLLPGRMMAPSSDGTVQVKTAGPLDQHADGLVDQCPCDQADEVQPPDTLADSPELFDSVRPSQEAARPDTISQRSFSLRAPSPFLAGLERPPRLQVVI
jgi:hypothetical protein